MSAYEPSITPEMRERYLARRRDDFASLNQAIETKDFATMRAIAHQIKGNAATFQFDELAELAVQLEQFAEASALKEASEIVARMHAWMVKAAAD